MYDVVVLSLAGAGCASEPPPAPRVPALVCADALTAGGARVEHVTARADAEIDAVLARWDVDRPPGAPPAPDPDPKTRLVVAVATDAQLRAVVRRMVRRYTPPPSRRPADLPATRTVPDLPPLAVLPLDARAGQPGPAGDLAGQLGLARDPATVAAAVLGGRIRRLDLLRQDGGSVTLDGALIGGVNATGRAVPWQAVVEVDDAVLSEGREPLLACAVGNAAGYARPDGLPLITGVDPADGVVEVAVACPVVTRSWGRRRVRVEVRRARGRAVAVHPAAPVAYLDDGVAGTLSHKRSWWIEAAAWSVYTS